MPAPPGPPSAAPAVPPGSQLRPGGSDGLGVWEEGEGRLVFCLEYDRSTESLDRLAAKLPGYVDLQVATGQPYWVLFCFRHRRREAGARRVLAKCPPSPVATAVLGPIRQPHEAICTPIGNDGPPMLLTQLTGVPLPVESYERVEQAREYRRQDAERG